MFRLKWLNLIEIIKYYQAGILNSVFGLGLYSAFIKLGLNIYFSQLLSHIIGVSFNYIIYRNHVFKNSEPAKFKFLISYVINYFISLIVIFPVSKFVKSPYLIGVVTIFIASFINYFALKFFVFRKIST